MSDPFVGEIRMVGFNYAPQGWLQCLGQLVPVQQNQALFALLGVTYGGDGVTTFGLPDFRGRSPVGIGNGPGLTPIVQGELGGAEITTLLQAQMPMHTHVAQFAGQPSPVSVDLTTTVTVDVGTSVAGVMVPPAQGATTYLNAMTAKVGANNVTVSGLYSATAPDATKASLGGITASTSGAGASVTPTGTVVVSQAGGSQPLPLRNPMLGMNFIIATNGIFPSRP